MVLTKRYCIEYVDGTIECFREGFWFSSTGLIIKWSILAAFFLFFTAWFFGGYLHAKQRLRKGKPLLAYHRWLVSYQDRKKYGQAPQNSFSFYAHQNPYAPSAQQQSEYPQQRADGSWPEPPPMYTPGKNEQSQQQPAVQLPVYGSPAPAGPYPPPPPQANGDVEGQQLPPRPPKAAVKTFLGRFGRK